MRLLPNTSYGTGQYPEKVARHLRLVNATAWVSATATGVFAVAHAVESTPGLWRSAVVNLVAALACLAVPLLHRFGALAGVAALTCIALWEIVGVTLVLGTGSGMYLYSVLIVVLPIALLMPDRIVVIAALAVLGAATVIALHAFVPQTTGVLPAARMFVENFLPSVIGSFAILFAIVLLAVRQVERAEAVAEREFARSESLLANILPQRVASQLKDGGAGHEVAESHPAASILFADLAGFTASASDTEPRALVRFLNTVFVRLDELVERHGLEKVKTTGDAYMVVSGVPEARADHAQALAALALDMRSALDGLVDARGRAIGVRIGIASGPVVAGVVGRKKFFYDVWGDAVNTASRMESTGEAGRIQVDATTFERLQGEFDLEARGTIEVRGKGPMQTWYLIGRKPG